MSVVIVDGNEQMVCRYEDICKNHGCKAKVFVKGRGAFKKKIGWPDPLILFTDTVSRKTVNSAVEEAKRNNVSITHILSSSASALKQVLCQHCGVS